MIKNRFTFSENQITAIHREGEYLWIAFLGTGGISYLYKVSKYNPNVRYFDLNIQADKITKITDNGSYIYLSLDDDDYIGMRLSKTSPLTSYFYYTKPVAITEEAISLVVGDYTFLLIPGSISGSDAKLLRFSKTSNSLLGTITLTGINNARAITIDDSNNLWVVTYTSPTTLVKIEDGTWNVTSEDIT